MANVLKYDVNTGRVLKYLKSVNTSDYLTDPNDVNTPLSGYFIHPVMPHLELKYLLVDGGIVRDMTQIERDTVDLAQQQAADQTERDRIDELDVSVYDVIIALVKRINVRIPNNPITKAEVIQQIKDDKSL